MINDIKIIHTTNIGPLPGKKITAIIRAVFDHFKGKNTMYVFDGAHADNVLLQQLRNYIKEDDLSQVVVTSRSNNWDSFYSIISVDVFSSHDSIIYIKRALRDLSIPRDEAACDRLVAAVRRLPLALNKSTEYIIKQNNIRVYMIDDFIYEMQHGTLPTTPDPFIPPEDPDIDWVARLSDETERITGQISYGATDAWEKVSSGATQVGGKISDGANRAGQEISRAADHVGSSVQKFFSGFG